MPVTRRAFLLALAISVAAAGCGGPQGPPDTGVDLTTPVRSLPGWDALAADLGLTGPQLDSLADWVDVFREGLDISRRHDTEAERRASEHDWWTESERSLAALVGEANVARVITWLEMVFGRRDGAA